VNHGPGSVTSEEQTTMALQIHDHSHSHIIIGVVVLLPQITQFQTAKSNKCEVGMVEIWEDHNLF